MRPVTDLQRTVAPFEVISEYTPSGDQPKAIKELTARIQAGEKDVVLLGATGTGKSATTAWLIEQVQRPTLVMAPNKTLAAQLATEFRELLPNNAVEYFVSYYDYYQPEAYIAQTDTYIEKDSSINDEVERLRHSATSSLLTRRDVIVVASVSCIYGLGTPQEYVDRMVTLSVGDQVDRDQLLRKFVTMQYTRNDMAFTRGTFRVRGDTVEIIPVYEELAIRIEFFGDEIEAIATLHPLTGDVVHSEQQMHIFPATHYVAGPERMERAIMGIELELEDRLAELERQNKLLEAQRLRMRTTYDIEMMRQIGSCSGIENYSRHIDGRSPGSAPNTLIDYFPEDFLLVIDESHVTVPQIGAMFEGDMSRKRALVDHGFRLPSATDNRPLRWEEFVERIGQTVYLSATPGNYELSISDGVVEQIIRPTGLVDPEVVVKPTTGQIDDLLGEIHDRVDEGRARARHHADQEDGRGPDGLLPGEGGPRPLPALRGGHAAPRRAAARAADGRVRRPGRHQPAARGSRPAGGVAGRHPRRRQGGLPALRAVAHPDDRPRGPQRLRPGAHVRGPDHGRDGAGHRRDVAAPREAGRLQPRERHRPDAAAQEDRRHHGPAGPRGRRHRRAARAAPDGSPAAGRRRCPGSARRVRRATSGPGSRVRPRASWRTSSSSCRTRCTRRPASSSSSSRRGCATRSRA